MFLSQDKKLLLNLDKLSPRLDIPLNFLFVEPNGIFWYTQKHAGVVHRLECLLAKEKVEGSIPFARSNFK